MKIQIYDTTLRDGTQSESVAFSVDDKLRVARKLDELGIDYIEGGWPGSNDKDAEFFRLAASLPWDNAKLAAFGSTAHPNNHPQDDPNLLSLVKASTPVVTIFGKSWDFHVTNALKIPLARNCDLIRASVAWLKEAGREVIYDAEHFFDGFAASPEYALATLRAAEEGGADMIVLCDTNGGSLTRHVEETFRQVQAHTGLPLGIHTHNDSELAVANSLAAVACGAVQVQGTINGYGERCGNADLVSVIGNLQLKMGIECIPSDRLSRLTDLSRYVSEVANVPPFDQRPFVGKSAFAHKGGLHVSAITKNRSAYEHLSPELVGNRSRVLVSDLAGKSNVVYKAKEMNIPLDLEKDDVQNIVNRIKAMEDFGYQYDAAEGSFELLTKKLLGRFEEPFTLKTLRVVIEKNEDSEPICQVTIKIAVGDKEEITAAEGDGPVNAMDNAVRKALVPFFPDIREMRLVDFKVRVIEGTRGTAARVRVLIQSRDQKDVWGTVGVSENIIEASWQALMDSLYYKLSLIQNGKR